MTPIFNERLALYQTAHFSNVPWGTITVGAYLRWTETGVTPSVTVVGDPWKARNGRAVMENSFEVISKLRQGVPPREKDTLKTNHLTAVSWGHCNPVGEASSIVVPRATGKRHDSGTRYVCFDIDGFETIEQAMNERDRLFTAIPSLLAAGLSASGRGVWLVIAMSRNAKDEEDYKNLWWLLAVKLQQQYGVKIGMPQKGAGATDRAPSNMVSLRFYSHDKDLRVRTGNTIELFEPPDELPDYKDSQRLAEGRPVEQIPQVPPQTIEPVKQASPQIAPQTAPVTKQPATRNVPATKKTKPTKQIRQTKKALAELRSAIEWANDNGITNVITDNATFSCFALGANQIGLPIEEQIEFCESQEGDKTGIAARLRSTNSKEDDQRASCLSLFRNKGWVVKKKEIPPPEGTLPVPDDLGSSRGFMWCLERLGIQVRANELVGIGIEVKLPGKGWQELQDEIQQVVAIDYVAAKCVRKAMHGWTPFEINEQKIRGVFLLLSTRQPPVNETRNWLKSIDRKYIKDDISGIDEYIACYKIDGYGRLADGGYTKEQIREYYRAGFILKMATWILRSLFPGCLVDKFVVAVGERACGKGIAMQLELPPEHICPKTGRITPNKAFKDNCHLSSDRTHFYHNRTCSLGEVTELVGFSKPGNEKLKAIISATHDHVEMKYRNYSQSIPKSYGLVGTTNNRNFKPADGEGDRRTFVLDLGYGFAGGRRVTRIEIPKVLTNEWRLRAVGYILWLIEQGYCADTKDWSPIVEEMREFLVGQSSKHYPRIEQALIDIADGMADTQRVINGLPTIKREWERYGYQDLTSTIAGGDTQIRREGLPFNPDRWPQNLPTWMRLLTLHDKGLVDRHGADTIKLVATEHLGWTWHAEPKSGHGWNKPCRNWLIPNPTK